ncbi:15-hydroxyprostaglandin dehydrogenase [NAD(+)]-like [Rhynchophorus ferrugineus]|uniref:15-hydroxyprostaglandin dehydrogenase [NAD(+)]-like n=1 Tax=Rhynchophorus ferrugineus TaxID=354439 RepID=UPI003FCD6700
MFLRQFIFKHQNRIKIAGLQQLFSHSVYKSHDEDEDTEGDLFNIQHCTAIINGGASGIGLAVAKQFLQKGVQRLSIMDIDAEKGEDAQGSLSKTFGDDKVLFFEADVTNAKELDDAYRKSIQFHDIPDVVVNCAGIIDDTKWEKQLKTNMAGCVIGTLLGMQYMSKSSKGYGGIVTNISSIFGITPSSGYPLHTMTQFGICGFTKAIGCGIHFTRTGVKIFALCPGLTDTLALTEAPKNAINDRFAQEFADEIADSNPQKTESVARGLTDILDEANPGSIWVVENDNAPYEIIYPGPLLNLKKDTQRNRDEYAFNTT